MPPSIVKRYYIIKVLLVVVLITTIALGSVANGSNILEARSFSLRSNIFHATTSTNSVSFSLDEAYSFDKIRAKIGFSSSRLAKWRQSLDWTTGHESGTYIYDPMLDISLLQQPEGCIDWSLQRFLNNINLEFIESLPINGPDSIVGPARLLYYVLSQKHLLKLEATHGSDQKPAVPTLGVSSLVYTLDLDPQLVKTVDRLYVYFETMSMAHNSTLATPHRVEFVSSLADSRGNTISNNNDNGTNPPTKIGEIITSIEYSQLRFLDDAFGATTNSGDSTTSIADSLDVRLDPFSVEPLSGCSRLLAQTKARSLYLTRSTGSSLKPTRFSFKAQVEYSMMAPGNGRPVIEQSLNFRVNYDGQLNMMRQDIEDMGMNLENFVQIFNFNTSLVYNILEKTKPANYMLSHLIKLASQETSGTTGSDLASSDLSQCVIAPLASQRQVAHEGGTTTTTTTRPLDLDQLLVGSAEFVCLGFARVRGVNSLVFESHSPSSHLPYWLEPPVSYQLNRTWTRKTREARQNLLTNRDDNLTIVVYLGEEQSNDQLLQMEIYRWDSTNPALLHDKRTIRVYEFVWDLEHLLHDGQRAGEMFALQEHCSRDTNGGGGGGGGGGGHLSSSDRRRGLKSGRRGDADFTSRVELFAETAGVLPAARRLPQTLVQFSTDRKLALLAGLQASLDGLCPNMVYDLSARLIGDEPTEGSARKLQLVASFLVASHPRTIVELVHLGRGRRELGQSWYYQLHSFQACYMLASHRRADVHFGFEPNRKYCFIATKSIAGASVAASNTADQPEQVFGFTLDAKQGNLEVYQTRHFTKSHETLNWTNVNSYEANRVKMLNRQLVLEDPTYLSNGKAMDADPSVRGGGGGGGGGANNQLTFEIKRLNVIAPDQASVFNPQDSLEDDPSGDADQEAMVDKIEGYGLGDCSLNYSRHICQRLEAVPQHSTYMNPFGDPGAAPTAMTVGQCRATCLAEPKCRFYSVCLSTQGGAELECSLGKVSLEKNRILAQIRELEKRRRRRQPAAGDGRASSRGRTFKLDLVELAGGQMELRRHPNCALYRKKYIDNFKPIPRPIETTLFGMRLVRVSSLDKCAELCTNRNLEAFRSHVEHVSDSVVKLADSGSSDSSAASLVDAGHLLHTTTKRYSLNQALVQRVCFKIYYLDSSTVSGLSAELAAKLVAYSETNNTAAATTTTTTMATGEHTDEASSNYCAISVKPSVDEAPLSGIHQKLDMFQYDFKMDFFYEEDYGVSLLASQMSPEEKRAYDLVRRADGVGRAGVDGDAMNQRLASPNVGANELELIRGYLTRGENTQIVHPADKTSCALLCMMQSLGPWPMCKSYDIVVVHANRTLDNSTTLMCQLNSITLAQAISMDRMDLVRLQADDGTREATLSFASWHYEPRSGLVLGGPSSSLAMDDDDDDDDNLLGGLWFNPVANIIVHLLLFCGSLFVATLIYDNYLGAKLRSWFPVDRRDSITRPIVVMDLEPQQQSEPKNILVDSRADEL